MSEQTQPLCPETTSRLDNDNDNNTTYFEDVEEQTQQLATEREKLKAQEDALKQLDERVSKIDCDLGAATLSIDGEGVITVKTHTNDLQEPVKDLLHNYEWSQKFDIGYDTRKALITFELKSTIETLTINS